MICRALRSAHFIGLQSTSDRTEPEEDSPVHTTRADKFRVYRFPWRQGSLFPSKHSGVSIAMRAQSSLDERKEKGAGNIRREHQRDSMRMPDEELNRTKHTQRKNSRTSSNEDKVERRDTPRQRESQAHVRDEVQWTKHASRSDSQAQQCELTSLGGVLVERVYEQRPHDMSTTTCTTQPQGLALCSRCHLAWASVAPQWVPARTPTVHWGRYNGRPWVARHHATNGEVKMQ